jgi:endonuclease V-like protein UPF0215 family
VTGKPGLNYLEVSPAHRKRINPIVAYYRKKPRPFTSCVKDNRKRFGPNTERVCAVVKDMAENTTHWRKGDNRGRRAVYRSPLS